MSIDWRELPSLAALRAFDATARHASFAAAARSLNVSHAAIAQQVRGLEAALGTRLAVRNGRTVALTEAGERLALGLSQGFTSIATAIADLRAREARRALRVTTTTFLADVIIMPRLAEFWAAHPGVEIALHPTQDRIDIVKDGYDFAIRAVFAGQYEEQPGTETEHLSRERLIAAAAPALLDKAPADVHRLPWLWHDDNAVKLRMMTEAGVDIDAVEKVAIGSPKLQLEAVRQGIGITIFNHRIIRADLDAGRVVELPLPRRIEADYVLIFPTGPRRPIVRDFVAWLRGMF